MGVIIGLSAAGVTAPAHASDPLQLDCSVLAPGGGNGSTHYDPVIGTDKWAWSLSGIATCNDQFNGQYQLTFTGAGTSTGLGLCSADGTVTNLSLAMDITLLSIDTGLTKEVHENWGASTTTFPEGTPFVVTLNGATAGAGTIVTHIFDHCPPGGTSSTVYQWTQSL
jgi:hypothetical protein